MSIRSLIAGIFAISALPLLVVEMFPSQLKFVMQPTTYLVFHNIAELFSVVVSFSKFGLIWYTHGQSKDRHALFLGIAFLGIGLIDSMHTLSMAAMPDFITPNIPNKSVQFWIAVRVFQAIAFLLSAFIYAEKPRWVSKGLLLAVTLLVSSLVFICVIFFPSLLPTMFIEGRGVTPLKKFSEYLIIVLLFLAIAAYSRRMARTGDRACIYYLAAFIVCIFSELPLAFYAKAFDTYNLLGHINKIIAFYLIYYGIFRASVKEPYIRLAETTEGLNREVAQRKRAEEEITRHKEHLEDLVKARTAELEISNVQLTAEASVRKRSEEALQKSNARANLLSATAGKLLATDNPQAIVNELCRDVMAHLDCHAFFNFLVDENVGRLHLNAWAGIPEEEAEKIEWLDFGIAVCGCAARDGSRIVAEHIPTTPDVRTELVKSYGIKAYACHPLLGPGRKVIGTLSFGTRTRETFSEMDLSLMKAVADQVAVAMERMRLIKELQTSRDELEIRVQERTAEVAQALGSLKVERQRLFDVLETMPAMVCLLTPDHHVAFSNRSFREKFGESGGRHCYEYCFGYSEPCDFCETYKVLETGKPHHWEVKTPDGSIIDAYDFTFTDVDGSPLILEMDLDITERKQAEAALRKAHDKLREEMARREKAEEQLRQSQKMEAIGTLTGGIAHDLNNILAPIVINSELMLLDLDGNPEMRSQLDFILKSGLRGRELVKQLLLFSRKSEKKHDVITLTPLVKESFKLLRASIPATVDMKLHLQTESDAIYGDPSQIQQVIMNLCTNAAYAMRGKTGSIDISLRDDTFTSPDLPETDMEAGDYLVLSCKDTGYGMDEEVKKRIFEPFFTTKPTGEGTGLGLAVVYGIVKNHRGSISVYSEPGKGSVFNIYLPKVVTQSSEAGEEIKPIPRGTERILLVDDEESLLNSIGNMFQHLGYKVAKIMGSREALRLFAADPSQFDLVITDQTMPHMTGESLGKELLRIRPDISIILSTGYADLISSEKAKEMGFQGFIMKPFTVREGAELVRRVLDKGGKP